MTLTDPREALAEQSNFIGYLLGLAGLAEVVRTLATDTTITTGPTPDADDFVHLLLGIAGVGAMIDRVAYPSDTQRNSNPSGPPSAPFGRWLR